MDTNIVFRYSGRLPGLVLLLGLFCCLGSSPPETANPVTDFSTASELYSSLGIDPYDLQEMARNHDKIVRLLWNHAASQEPDTLFFESTDLEDRVSPILAKTISFRFDALAPRPARVPPVVVATDTLALTFESEDCASEGPLELRLDPEVTSLYIVNHVVATCQDESGETPVDQVLVIKNGEAGVPFSSAATAGIAGLPVGSSPPPNNSGVECGDPGVDGLDATGVVGPENTGGTGGLGAVGASGGDVAPTTFAVLGTLNAPLNFELSGGVAGDGQDGGTGGAGGDGQDGGDASSGMPACCYGNCTPEDCTLETLVPAGTGGDGGDGSDGGDGGRGGDGGAGGGGGTGGLFLGIVEMSHYSMFSVNSMSGGLGGRGGRPGNGGSAGTAGDGGTGGWDGANCEFLPPAKQPDGQDGVDGSLGASGNYGATGAPGESGKAIILPYSPSTPERAPAPKDL